MSESPLTRLFPEPLSRADWPGLYLAHRLHQRGQDRPFVYGSFVSSLDGRIALIDEQNNAATPKALTTASDWRLLQELHAQADCIITHGGYLRALAGGRLGNLLQVQAVDLQAWRAQQGLSPQPAIIVVSASLDFPLPDSIQVHQQSLYIATTAASNASKVKAWCERGYEVLIAGERCVEGLPLVEFLSGQGYRSIYLLAGPKILEAMLRDAVLSRLYLTLSHRLIGGPRFHSLIAGKELGEEGVLQLCELYLEAGEAGQFFACFEPNSRADI